MTAREAAGVKPRCVPASLKHAKALAPILSQADKDEIAAASGRTPLEALEAGVRSSVVRRAYVGADGLVFAIQGVLPGGVIWMLSSDAIQEPANRWFFARRAKSDLAKDQAKFGRLHNHIDARNRVHRRLLEWLGFEFGPSVLRGPVAFIPFWRENNV